MILRKKKSIDQKKEKKRKEKEYIKLQVLYILNLFSTMMTTFGYLSFITSNIYLSYTQRKGVGLKA
ncbi:hypothetical protein RchiOBHm_Chr6g0245831 [Rosa chinensis]|uniref:Uncharacterized protein n=1 Tax=Rosa chinensis TaxID=74649 RepID=A0A2P6PJD9_ROSCH|nr:hypothetical protein RchiOBHm_Chr6g0245831 [Rosa chinensis]